MGAKLDYKSLLQYRDNMAKLNGAQTQYFIEAAVKELAARLLRKAAKLTPVGRYPAGSGKTGGTLRRNWTIGKVVNVGRGCSVEVINPTSYAMYVEFGHCTRGRRGWVDGRFMLTISEQELKRDSPRILQNKLNKFVREVVNADK